MSRGQVPFDSEQRPTKIQIAGKFLTVLVLCSHDEVRPDWISARVPGYFIALFG
ncbi:MAG: hypothetical protein JWP57_1716 [Spirosoma sp.]|nr:hypothetical protein [Spirosoma sp.]